MIEENKKNRDLVTIIMPCYNGEKYIRESIDSVINQTYKNWELLVIDDGSTDSSKLIIQSFSDIRVKYLLNKASCGRPYSPRNVGIEKAKGRFIAFLDCDDKWLPSKLNTQVQKFYESDCAVVFSYYKKMNELGEIRNSIVKSPLKVTYRKLLYGNCIGNLTAVYDVSKVGKVFQKNVHHEDYVMWLEILKNGNFAVNTDTVEAIYRESAKSISGNKFSSFKWTWNIYRNELKLSIFSSLFHFTIYAFKALYKFLK